MAIAPLQLPGPLVVPRADLSGLNEIGEAYANAQERRRQQEEFGRAIDMMSGAPSAPSSPAPMANGAAMAGVPRGIRNNNPGNIKDGALAKALPGYKGNDGGGFAVFDTPDNGFGAMDALLTSYGRRGLKTVRDVVGRWAPASDGNDVEAYSRFVSNGNPDVAIDLNDPQQRRALAQRMAQFENGTGAMGQAAPGAPGRAFPPEQAARIKALFAVGTPAAQAAAYQLLGKFVGKQEPIKIGEGDTLIDPNTYQPIASGPGKAQDVRPGGALVQNGKVIYQAPATDAGEKVGDQIKAREANAKRLGMDASDERTRAYILTGKMPGEDKMPITPTDKKAIIEADEHVQTHEQTISNLNELKQLSKKAWGFVGSGPASRVLAPVNQGAQDTAELNTTATANALNQLKAIFGAAPTEGERKILLDIQGSSALPDPLRQKIYDRAIVAVNKRLDLAKRQAEGLRDRTYWKPGGGVGGATPSKATPPQIGTPEFDALPTGGLYTAPDGSVRTKRGP